MVACPGLPPRLFGSPWQKQRAGQADCPKTNLKVGTTLGGRSTLLTGVMDFKRYALEVIMSKLIRISVCLSFLLLSADFAYGERALRVSKSGATVERKIALVIGNGDYRDGPLKNPPNDAADIAVELRRLDFTVTKLINATQSQMRRAIREFGRDLRKGGVGLFFYAGHGMQVRGINYLIPVGAAIQEEDEVQDYGVDAGMVLRKLQTAGNRLNMVFLDACRNNPFARSFRSSQRGLAQMDAPSGSLISYATAPGKTAADGTGRNGTFTKHFLKQLRTSSSVELAQLMKKVGKGVQLETEKKQIPWVASSITGDFYFSGKGPAGAGTSLPIVSKPKSTTLDEEEEFWKAIKDSSSQEDFNDYLNTYPNGRFAKIARIKIRQLKKPLMKSIEGAYTVQGINPNGSTYRGNVVIWQEADYYKMKWQIGRNTFHGKGQRTGNILTINWGQQYPVIYKITDSGVLNGTWQNGSGKETLFPGR